MWSWIQWVLGMSTLMRHDATTIVKFWAVLLALGLFQGFWLVQGILGSSSLSIGKFWPGSTSHSFRIYQVRKLGLFGYWCKIYVFYDNINKYENHLYFLENFENLLYFQLSHQVIFLFLFIVKYFFKVLLLQLYGKNNKR